MMRVHLEVETPLSTTIDVSNQILMFIYQKIKDEQTSKVRKSITRDKNLNDSFYLIFFDTNTKFKTLQTLKI
jgi:hypothetical protein